MHKGRISLEKKSHIVSFDDARRSVRNDHARSDASARSSSSARGGARGSFAAGSSRESSLGVRREASSSSTRAGGSISATSRGGASVRRMPQDRYAAHGSATRAGRRPGQFAPLDDIGEEIDSIWATSRNGHGDARSERAPSHAARTASGSRYGSGGGRELEAEGEHEPDERERTSLAGRLSEKLAASKRARAKDKAERRFTQQYGGSDAGKAAAEAAGPRAAVYKGEMGSKHKRAAQMQNTGESARSARGASAKKSRAFHPALLASAAVAACLLFGCVFLYGPAKTYYQEVRECDRLEAEYAALQQRNDAIQDEVDALSTDAGIEDKARSEFGWVKEGENAVSVSGLDVEEESNFTANIVPGSVEAPDTWYSFLDPIFGVE